MRSPFRTEKRSVPSVAADPGVVCLGTGTPTKRDAGRSSPEDFISNYFEDLRETKRKFRFDEIYTGRDI